MDLPITVGSKIDISGKSYSVEKFLGKGKSGFSFLIRNRKYLVLKLLHKEQVSYYNFSSSKLDKEINDYNILNKFIKNLPELIYVNKEKNILVKEYIEGTIASRAIADNFIDEEMIEKLFDISNKAKEKNYNLDYFPSNFVIANQKLFYIDYELNKYDYKWSFENWGIYYWLNYSGFKKFLETNDASYINEDCKNGIPIKTPFSNHAKYYINKYSV